MSEYESIDHYLKDLEHALKGLDPALIADALDDAEEHLESSIEDITSRKKSPDQEALNLAIEEYGSPLDIAEEYRKLEPVKGRENTTKKEKRSLLYQIFGVYLEPKTYLNLVYLLLQFPLGIAYFSYLAVAAMLVAVLVITLVGIPLGILFLLSIFALSWFQGRLSEAFLGIRMPRKKRKLMTTEPTRQKIANSLNDLKNLRGFTSTPTWRKMTSILRDPRLYTSGGCLFLIFPLGIIYFTGIAVLVSAATALTVSPLPEILYVPVATELFEDTWAQLGLAWFGTASYTIIYPVIGIVLLTGSLHLFNAVARIHGRMMKRLLVKR
ncbi:MAG: sensor domain-containing protein [Theionarchaea archaeon]|nr:sensor domain-containing protein [Theionarchaea archaeon]MBU7000430.1 sensor domain-containing protein [Theionarchaea archaeon]MBU7021273.1 sensor domain-containing protein [Theionarchaea archaeon]MBU7036048.1 sensor domain-containing protein [Theionarchaea archaeon]MBU7039764.1 sensor domain-containing protein [Theionarchaea archaeon]